LCLQQRRLGINGEESRKFFRNGDRGEGGGYPGSPGRPRIILDDYENVTHTDAEQE